MDDNIKGSSFKNARFIYSDFPLYYSTDSSPWADIPKSNPLRQHEDIVPQKGLPMFAKDFQVSSPKKAVVTLSALGVIDLWLNGKRVGGKDELKPGFCSFNKRTYSFSYDVTALLREGTNRLLAVCSNGWYSGRISGDYYGANPAAVAVELELTDKNGVSLIATDESWRTAIGGTVLFADIWDGEYCDGRKASYEAASKPDYDISTWGEAKLFDRFEGQVTPFIGPTVQVREELTLRAKGINVYSDTVDNSTDYGEIKVDFSTKSFPFEMKKGQRAVIDFGQNAVGVTSIRVQGKAGTAVKIRYAEMLNDSGDGSRGNDGPKGSVYTVNMRSAKAKSYYVLSGKGIESYRPTFTFFGFRYVEITADNDFTLHGCEFKVIGSATEEVGKIETSNSLLNQLISNVIWGQRSNYFYVPTDCPQRDERLGWTGDTQTFCLTAAYNADILGFMRKWLQDMRDAQGESGGYPDVVPRVQCCNSENASAWGDAGIIVPYNMYLVYGDTSIIKEHYESMERYIDSLVREHGYKGAKPVYGDWLAYDLCKNEFVSSAYFVQDLDMMVTMSRAIGENEKAEYYAYLRGEAYKYFSDYFMKNGELVGKTQADFAISLNMGLLSEDYAEKAAGELVRLIKENGNRLSTGFLGTYHLLLALSKMREDNMAYTLLLQREEPSWLYSIDQGATTIWERWNSYTLKNGFGDVSMNSFNHYAYGSVQEWMYRYMAGIDTEGAGFSRILFTPRIDTRAPEEIPEGQERITWVKASYRSVKGLIESSWQKDGESFTYECTVPEGCTATLLLPVFAESFTVNGVRRFVEDCVLEQGCVKLSLNEGSYCFKEN